MSNLTKEWYEAYMNWINRFNKFLANQTEMTTKEITEGLAKFIKEQKEIEKLKKKK